MSRRLRARPDRRSRPLGGASTPPVLSLASSSMGPYPANTQFYRQTAADLANLGLDSCIDIVWEQRGLADETILAYCDATSGYFINHNSTGDTRIFLRSGAPTNHVITSTVRKTLNRLLVWRTPGGALRASLNGAAAFQLSAAPSYVDAAATAELILGRSMSAVGTSGCTTVRHVHILYYRAAPSDATGQAISGTVNDPVNRWKAGATALAHLASSGGWHFDVDRDFVAANASVTAGAGTTPVTLTKNGANINKNTIPAFIEKDLPASLCTDGGQFTVLNTTTGQEYRVGQFGERWVITTDATDIVIKTANDWSGVPNMPDVGVYSSGVFQSNSATANGGIDGLEFGLIRYQDIFGLAGGDKTVELVDGPPALAGTVALSPPVVRGQSILKVMVPVTASFTITPPPSVTNMLLEWGDSIIVGQQPTTSSITQAHAMLTRADYPGAVVVDGYGSGAYWHLCNDDTAIAATVARWVALTSRATGTIRIGLFGGTNDYGFWNSLWGTAANRANFITRVTLLLQAAKAAIPSATFHIFTPILRVNETTLIPAVTGVNLQNVRDDLATAAAAAGAYVIVHDGTTLLAAPPNANYQDNVHPNSSGHSAVKAGKKTFYAGSSDSVGSGY